MSVEEAQEVLLGRYLAPKDPSALSILDGELQIEPKSLKLSGEKKIQIRLLVITLNCKKYRHYIFLNVHIYVEKET